jgi:hypothetical protein
MINGYIVKYTLGKKNIIYQLWIAAHNKSEAQNNARIQAGFRHGRGYKFNLVSIEDEYEVDIPEDKPQKINKKVYASNNCIYYTLGIILFILLSICLIPTGLIILLQGAIK